jgi:NAD-dependent deacetylase
MDLYEAAAKLLARAKHAIAFTGAGISAESGIPTFRDPGGIWDQFDPDEFGTAEGILSLAQREPERIRRFLLNVVSIFEGARPNPAHDSLSELEKRGILNTIVTQNIDNLHSDAGNLSVFEVHGSLFRARCTRCGRRYPLPKAALLRKARELLSDPASFRLEKVLTILPACDCGSITRPDVVMFGEPVQQLNQSFRAATSSDVMLVLGTSGVVYPAAALPHQAHQAGAKIIEINSSENCYSAISEVYIKEPTGQAMPKVMERLRNLCGN